ncbi:hypothetical protein BDR03DRAFT_389075 [Suillus americanus]|nr:hypothetical protein BDR03DRAFT_389075 [Suillus americanus]
MEFEADVSSAAAYDDSLFSVPIVYTHVYTTRYAVAIQLAILLRSPYDTQFHFIPSTFGLPVTLGSCSNDRIHRPTEQVVFVLEFLSS